MTLKGIVCIVGARTEIECRAVRNIQAEYSPDDHSHDANGHTPPGALGKHRKGAQQDANPKVPIAAPPSRKGDSRKSNALDAVNT